MSRAVVMFSGGVGSWATARRVGPGATLLFADTLMEDEDLYRFLREAAEDVRGELVTISDGRNPWELFRDEGFIGNTRVDICSRVLKRDLLRRWLQEHCDSASTTVYLGIDWTEAHRLERARPRWHPWTIAAPLCEPPLLDKADHLAALRDRGIEPPRLYGMGFPHNNCGGACVKAGQGQWAHLFRTMPDRYRWHEDREHEFREASGKDVAILRDRRGGDTRPLTLAALRQRLEAGDAPEFDWGGCGCAVD